MIGPQFVKSVDIFYDESGTIVEHIEASTEVFIYHIFILLLADSPKM